MLTLLRLISFVLGCAITVAPAYLILVFAYGVGDPPNTTVAFYFLPLVIGLIFGMGPLMIGFPKLVAGPEKPGMRVAAGAFLFIFHQKVKTTGFSRSASAMRIFCSKRFGMKYRSKHQSKQDMQERLSGIFDFA